MGCTNLKSVTCLATDISAKNCLNDWLKDAGTAASNCTLHVKSSMSEADWKTPDSPVWTVAGDQ
jgi:hypothetical protein